MRGSATDREMRYERVRAPRERNRKGKKTNREGSSLPHRVSYCDVDREITYLVQEYDEMERVRHKETARAEACARERGRVRQRERKRKIEKGWKRE